MALQTRLDDRRVPFFFLFLPIVRPADLDLHACPPAAVAQYHWPSPGFSCTPAQIRFNWL